MTNISSERAGEAGRTAEGKRALAATKQESCPESAPRTEYSRGVTDADLLIGALWSDLFNKDLVKPEGADLFEKWRERIRSLPTKSDGGVEGHAVNSCHIDHVVRHAHEHDQGRSALSSPPKYKAAGIKPGPSDQLTKTPSADHDDGNLHGLAAPNHQPHAVSQAAAFVAWAMREGSWDGGDLDGGALQDKAEELGLIIKTAYDPDIHGPSDYGAEPGDDWFVLHPDIEAASRPLPAPPSPAKTGGVE